MKAQQTFAKPKDNTLSFDEARELVAEGGAICNFCLKDVPRDDRWGAWTNEAGRVVYLVCGKCANPFGVPAGAGREGEANG